MQHDWFYYAYTCSVTGNRCVSVKDADVYGKHIHFANFKSLYVWAGY